jgi:hypothetical protein
LKGKNMAIGATGWRAFDLDYSSRITDNRYPTTDPKSFGMLKDYEHEVSDPYGSHVKESDRDYYTPRKLPPDAGSNKARLAWPDGSPVNVFYAKGVVITDPSAPGSERLILDRCENTRKFHSDLSQTLPVKYPVTISTKPNGELEDGYGLKVATGHYKCPDMNESPPEIQNNSSTSSEEKEIELSSLSERAPVYKEMLEHKFADFLGLEISRPTTPKLAIEDLIA